jgi:hypothetical protein
MGRFILLCLLSVFSFVQVSFCQLNIQHLDCLTIDSDDKDLQLWQNSLNIVKTTYLKTPNPNYDDLNELLDCLLHSSEDEISKKSLPHKLAITFAPYDYLQEVIDCIDALYDVNERIIEYYKGADDPTNASLKED